MLSEWVVSSTALLLLPLAFALLLLLREGRVTSALSLEKPESFLDDGMVNW